MMDFRAMEEAAHRIGLGEAFADAFQLEGIVKTEGSSLSVGRCSAPQGVKSEHDRDQNQAPGERQRFGGLCS